MSALILLQNQSPFLSLSTFIKNFKQYLIRYSGTQSVFRDTQGALKYSNIQGTRRALSYSEGTRALETLRRLEHSVTWAPAHPRHLGTQAHGHPRHLGTQTLEQWSTRPSKTLRLSGTRALEALYLADSISDHVQVK